MSVLGIWIKASARNSFLSVDEYDKQSKFGVAPFEGQTKLQWCRAFLLNFTNLFLSVNSPGLQGISPVFTCFSSLVPLFVPLTFSILVNMFSIVLQFFWVQDNISPLRCSDWWFGTC